MRNVGYKMSEYQYYEFCNINKPISSEVRTKMRALSSRTQTTTHSVAYTYNFGDFRGNPKELLAKYFDVFFYISNFGNLQLIFRYKKEDLDVNKIKTFFIQHVIEYETYGDYVLLDITIDDDNGGWGWIEGEGMLADLLPLYEEIKNGNYQLFLLIAFINAIYSDKDDYLINTLRKSLAPLSFAQQAFIKAIDFSIHI